MSDDGSCVTLIFYRINPKWWKEPALNLIAAAAQRSAYTHVEIAVGECAGQGGQMANVARVFNGAGSAASESPHSTQTCPHTGTKTCRRRS